MNHRVTAALGASIAIVVSGCGTTQIPVGTNILWDAADETCSGTPDDAMYPDVVGVEVSRAADGWTIGAWICSPYDTAERYADAWRVLDQEGNVLATRELTHPHADEQPFVRQLTDPLDMPASVTHLNVEARDSVNGWGGGTQSLDVRASAWP